LTVTGPGVRIPHFPQNSNKALTDKTLELFSEKSGTKTEHDIFGMENTDFLSPKKKMQKNLFTHDTLKVRYIPAELRTNPSGWYIEYYFLNPLSDNLERTRIKVNYIRKKLKSDRLAKQELKLYCNKINLKLESGWSPIVDNSLNGFKTLVECIDLFLEMKRKEVRGDTSYKHYSSQLNIFRNWILDNNFANLLPCDFGKHLAMEYMDYVQMTKNISNRTWNNYRTFMRSFFNWMIERNYAGKNHFSDMKKKRNEEKTRKPIPIEDRIRIVEHLKKEHYPFFIFILLEFSCLMRPVEIFRMKISNIDIGNQLIHLNGNQTKNGKSRDIVIPNNILSELIEYHKKVNLDRYNLDDYLFSTNYLPGKEYQLSKVATRTWSILRRDLKLPKEYQLYSLRDSFITESMNANVSPLSIQEHADHSSLNITSIYTHHKSKEVTDELRSKSPKLY